jgi:hypothetical protein
VRKLIAISLLILPALCSATEQEENEGGSKSWYLQGGGYAHFSEDEDYEGPPLFAGIERQNERNALVGFAVFNNSFGDFSKYLYIGKEWYPSNKYNAFRFKITVGVVHGYEGEHQDIFPINWGDAWGLGAVPTIGYQADRVGFDFAILSASGMLFLIGYEF